MSSSPESIAGGSPGETPGLFRQSAPRDSSGRSVHGPILEVRGLKKHFPLRRGLFGRAGAHLRAVDGIDLEIGRGETLALVGESGSGKTTLGRCILRLIEPTGGSILFDGVDLLSLDGRAMRRMRRNIQGVFQDPYASLNPRMTIGSIVGEPLAIHGLARGKERERRVAELLSTVGLDPRWKDRYPHEFSGGQRQRIGLARALAVEPRLVVCDEPVSLLDVSVQAQVINLLVELQRRLGLSYLFIAHDLSVVRHVADRVAVMYLGRIVETAGAREIYANPRHPYTQALLSAAPVADPDLARQRTLQNGVRGEMPSAVDPPSGCRFHTRCPIAVADCSRIEPPFKEVGEGHRAACLLAE